MPKKPNSHGMQEYVPAGNGDASGEYANEEGNNRHFTSFKKPEEGNENNSNDTVFQNVNKTNSDTETKETKAFEEYVATKFKKGKHLSKENLMEFFNKGTKAAQECVSRIIDNGELVGFSSGRSTYYSPGDKSITINNEEAIADIHTEGATFYHESGHAVDWALGIDKKIVIGSQTRTKRVPMSEVEITSNGKTLKDTIIEEVQEMRKSGVWREIVNAYTEEISAIPKFNEELTRKKNEYDDIVKGVEESAYAKAAAEIVYKRGYKKIFLQAYEKYLSDAIGERGRKLKKELDEAENQYKKLASKVKNKYATLSDMYSATYEKSYGFAGVGHKASYFRGDRGAIAHEFFAEWLAGKSVQDNVSITIVQKYMPKTAKACEELYQKAIKGGK